MERRKKERYHHLTESERMKIYLALGQGISLRKIAAEIGRSVATISREVRRNYNDAVAGYLPDFAHNSATHRRAKIGNKINRNLELKEYILEKIKLCRWSPAAISGRLKVENKDFYACPETIYKFVYAPENIGLGLKRHLWKAKNKRTKKSARKAKKSHIPERISIHERPPDASNRTEFGHFEADLMLFAYQRENLVTIKERKSRLILINKNPSKTKENTMKTIISKLNQLPLKAKKSVTFDNGGEFALHQQLNQIGINTYFCDPYASHQRGSIENSNGRIRKFLPKNTNLKNIDNYHIDQIQNILNNIPMKVLNFKTPAEAFSELVINCCTSS